MPGISSGVFLIIFGLYEKLIDSCLHFFNDIKKNVVFLCPIILGACLSIFLFSNILLFLLNNYYIYTCYSFMGLIFGSIPSMFKKYELNKPNFFHILLFCFSLVLSIYLILVEKSNIQNMSNYSYTYLILVGILMSAGIVIPGVSKTAILIIMGVYSTYLTAISTLDFAILFPIGIGLIIGGLIFMYIINFLFSYFKSYTYYSILGFVIASCFVIFPGFSFNMEYLFSLIIFISCFYLAKRLGKTHT